MIYCKRCEVVLCEDQPDHAHVRLGTSREDVADTVMHLQELIAFRAMIEQAILRIAPAGDRN